jgi:DNA-binding GntR family transcriptional regulator
LGVASARTMIGSSPPSKTIRPPSLHEEVASRLRTLIFERRLSPGSWIDELALARQWGISRTPLREALKVLAVEGLVTAHPGRGCQVAEMSEDDAAQLFPVMAILEGRCALEAVQHASDADLRGLQVLHDELERCAAIGDVEGYYRANHVFHARVQELAGNPWLGRATTELRKFMRLLRGRQLNWPGRMAESIAEHRALMQAIARRDAHTASTIMHDHLMAQLAALQALRAKEQLDATPRPADVAQRRDSTTTGSPH